MKYRVRLDLSFDNESDSKTLMDFARVLSAKASSINESRGSPEVSFCEREICRHDEGLPCTSLERIEVRNTEVGVAPLIVFPEPGNMK